MLLMVTANHSSELQCLQETFEERPPRINISCPESLRIVEICILIIFISKQLLTKIVWQETCYYRESPHWIPF